MRIRGKKGHCVIKCLILIRKLRYISCLVRKRSWFRSPSWAPTFQTLSSFSLLKACKNVSKFSLGRYFFLGANKGQKLSPDSSGLIRNFLPLKQAESSHLNKLSQSTTQKSTKEICHKSEHVIGEDLHD